ncbi:MAG: mechanosensitive ion channel family protein [Gammaproteobacteria bacterium]
MSWNSVGDALLGFYSHWQDLAYVILILLVTLVVTLIIHLVLHGRYWRQSTHRHVWRDAILGALNAPLQAVVWIIGLSVAEGALTTGGQMSLLAEVFPPARDVAAIAVSAWFLIRLTRRAVSNLHARAVVRGKEFDQTAADAIGKFFVAVIIIAAALIIMQALGFSIASLLTFGGIAGIALGFAAQGLVANLLGGITIYASHPFKVGDHIIFPGTNATGGYAGWQAGEVQHIGWRATRILDWNGKPFYVPNAKFNTETVINHSRMSFRQLSEFVYIRLEDIDRVAGIVEDVNHMLEEHPDMGDYIVFKFDGYGAYALKLYLYAYTTGAIMAYTDFMRVKQDVLLKIAAIIARHGARLAVPVSTVYMPEGLELQSEHRGGIAGPAAGLIEPPDKA